MKILIATSSILFSVLSGCQPANPYPNGQPVPYTPPPPKKPVPKPEEYYLGLRLGVEEVRGEELSTNLASFKISQ